MTQDFRVPDRGIVDRTRALQFSFDGTAFEGFAGDTVASALLANGVHRIARSFKYHRPRGIFGAGSDEPNALVQVGAGSRSEPNVRATVQDLHGGLIVRSQNHWPSLRFDVGALNDIASPLIPAGFYYKTFMWPPTPRWWLRYERAIRNAAGMGRAASEPDPDRYEHEYAHCDVLVVGAGPAGLAAALVLVSCGARVVVCDEKPAFGGSLLGGDEPIDGLPAQRWVDQTARELAGHPDVTLLARTTAFGCYDANLVGLVQRLDQRGAEDADTPRERLWKVRAQAVVLASGANERSIAYANNDRPGTMLAGAVQVYAQRFGVRCGQRAVVFTNNDSAYATALSLRAIGVEVAALVDVRSDAGDSTLARRAGEAGIALRTGSIVTNAHGRHRVTAVDIQSLASGRSATLDCDLVCVSGGWDPAVHLFSQARGRLRYDDALATFVPDARPATMHVAGAVTGCSQLAEALSDGHAAGLAAAAQLRRAAAADVRSPHAEPVRAAPLRTAWSVAPPRHRAKRFVDLQNDVTVADIALGVREGYQSVEHLKRYTTLGMGTDQGKTSNILGLALLAQSLDVPIPKVGTTTFRAPYTPVTLGAWPGRDAGARVEPTRRSAMHDWHVAHGAPLINAGLWKRPYSYPRPGESPDDAAQREARTVRGSVGVVDVSTLGKIELQGRDVAELLNRVYVNRWDTLQIGRCRYGVMLREDGIILDDGTTSRLGPQHYLMTTTTVNAVRVMQHLEFLLQVEWPELDVFVTSVTEQWSAAAIAGPRSREVVARMVDIDVSDAAFPFLAVAECNVDGGGERIPARLFRMSYSGELAYELHVASDRGAAMWEGVIAAGEVSGIVPYGTEAMGTLRIEKGHVVVGAEADGRTTADDLGMGKLVNAGKWCIGKPLLDRPALTVRDRWQLVGLTARDAELVPRGAKLVADPDRAAPNPMQGHVTSWCRSPNLDAGIALALLENGRARHGEVLWAVSPLENARVQVQVGPPCFIDERGERLRA